MSTNTINTINDDAQLRRLAAEELAIYDLLTTTSTQQEREHERVRTYSDGLATIRGQLDALMAHAPTARIERLLDAVMDGEIDGASYRGHCRCPLGWLEPGEGHDPASSFLLEAYAYDIHPGQTPETNGRLRRLERWVVVFLGRRYEEECAADEVAALREAASRLSAASEEAVG